MSQLFPPVTNLIANASVAALLLLVTGVPTAMYYLGQSSYMTRVDLASRQAVPFSHRHHVEGLGLDCRYCHTSVEDSSFANIPATSICMNCHTQIWSDSPLLEPVRQSYKTKTPLQWTRIYDMPDYVYFNHSIHVHKGIGCVTCHGRIDQEALTHKANAMFMEWCLHCHRDPQAFLKPKDQIYEMDSGDYPSAKVQKELSEQYQIRQTGLTDCYTCHR